MGTQSEGTKVADAILDVLGPGENVYTGNATEAIYSGLSQIATELKYLGGGENTDRRGAVEVLAISVKESGGQIADAINNLADAIRESKT